MLLRSLKTMSLLALRRVGLFSLVGRTAWRGQRLLILCFHGISLADEHLWNSGTYLPREVFAGRLRILRDRGYTVVPFSEGVRQLRAGTLPRKSVAITFDDGFYDFYRVALPLLNEYGYPATVYLTTYYSEYNVPVFGLMCSYVLWKARDRAFHAFAGGPSILCTDLRTPAARNAVLRAITDFTVRKALTGLEKQVLLVQVASSLRIDLDGLMAARVLHIMNRDEVARCAAAGVDIQLHTHRHRTPTRRDLFLAELEDNRACISKCVDDTALVHFCYPSGFVLREFLPWLRRAGVLTATTCQYGLASRDTDPLLLPRLLDTARLDDVEFEAWLCGLRPLLPLRPQGTPPSGRGCAS